MVSSPAAFWNVYLPVEILADVGCFQIQGYIPPVRTLLKLYIYNMFFLEYS
jgi:hypothetical protein